MSEPDEADVFAALHEVYGPEGVAIWWRTPNRMLDGLSPRRVWRYGALTTGTVHRHQRVYDLAVSLTGMVAT